MRKIKALIYALLGGMIAWGYWQRGDEGWAIFISLIHARDYGTHTFLDWSS
jgi:hypothetical protein